MRPDDMQCVFRSDAVVFYRSSWRDDESPFRLHYVSSRGVPPASLTNAQPAVTEGPAAWLEPISDAVVVDTAVFLGMSIFLRPGDVITVSPASYDPPCTFEITDAFDGKPQLTPL